MRASRDQSIDVLRGFAIVAMIVGHAIFFRYGLGSTFLNLLLHFANIFCYITFLFTYGFGLYHTVVRPTLDHARLISIIRRVLTLFIMYYVSAIISVWSSYSLKTWSFGILVYEAYRVLTFHYYPAFTEYLPSFAFFTILFVILKRISPVNFSDWFAGKKLLWTLALGLLIHTMANVLARLFETTTWWMRPLLGSTQTFDFPVLPYVVVVLLGIWIATWSSDRSKENDQWVLALGYTTLVIQLILKYSFNFTNSYDWFPSWLNTSVRWPPSPLFLLQGLSYTFLFWIIIRLLLNRSWLQKLTAVLHYIGTRSMGFLLYHLVLLFIMKILQVPMFNYFELAIFCVLIPVSYRAGEGLVVATVSRYNKR